MRETMNYDLDELDEISEGTRSGRKTRKSARPVQPERKVYTDPVLFAKEQLDFVPDPLQEQVLNDTIKRGILNCTRQWGKSTVTAAKALFRAQAKPNQVILVASPTARQSGEFIRKVEYFLRCMGEKPKGDGDNRMSVLLWNGSRIVGLPSNQAGTRGFSSVSLLLIDEASQVSDEVYYALQPSLAVSNGDMWLMSTPYGDRGFFWKEWTRDKSQWSKLSVRATDCPRISKEFLEDQLSLLGPDYFNQEYMCEFTKGESNILYREQVQGTFSPKVEPLFLDGNRAPLPQAGGPL